MLIEYNLWRRVSGFIYMRPKETRLGSIVYVLSYIIM